MKNKDIDKLQEEDDGETTDDIFCEIIDSQSKLNQNEDEEMLFTFNKQTRNKNSYYNPDKPNFDYKKNKLISYSTYTMNSKNSNFKTNANKRDRKESFNLPRSIEEVKGEYI